MTTLREAAALALDDLRIIWNDSRPSVRALQTALAEQPAPVRAEFARVCEALPEGVNWGDPVTPEMARHIFESAVPPATALQTLAKELPHGWTVQLDIQRGSGAVTLFGPHDDMYEPETGDGIEADMMEALRFARFRETETDKSVAKAWARFQAAMRRTGRKAGR